MTMKENQIAKSYDCKSLGREADPLTFESKESYKCNDSKMDTVPVALETKGRGEGWDPKVMDDFSTNKNGTKVFPRKEDPNRLSDHPSSWEEDLDLLSSETRNKEKEQRHPGHESLVTAEEFTRFNESESRDSNNPFNRAPDMSEKGTNLFSVKNVLECEREPPELEVCCKEMNDHIVKDICIDEGSSGKEKVLIENCKDDKSDQLVPRPCDGNYHFEATEVSPMEIANSLAANQCRIQTENNGKHITQERLKSPSHSSLEKDSTKHCDPKDSSGAEAGEPEQDVRSSSLLYNSNVETGSVAFNFNSPSPAAADTSNQVTEKVKEHSVDSVDPQDHANADDNFSNKNSNLHDQIPQHQDDKCADVQAFFPKLERRNSGNASLVNQLQYDQGEVSFSAASLITFSGPVVNSGSISHRSDGSTASTRSFAFPVLQSEWNSSPVRMAKADRRQFRKNKRWRAGLLCCGF